MHIFLETDLSLAINSVIQESRRLGACPAVGVVAQRDTTAVTGAGLDASAPLQCVPGLSRVSCRPC